MPHLISNLRVFLSIALDAAGEARRLGQEARTARPDGGYIVRLDPEQRSFKQSLIAIAFAGTFFEALLANVGIERLGTQEYEKLRWKKWEDRLRALGITDERVVASCKRFREARNDLMHEKPIDWENPSSAPCFTGQVEAAFGVDFVVEIAGRLGRGDLVPLGQSARPNG